MRHGATWKIRIDVYYTQRSIIAHDSPGNIVFVWRLRLFSEPYCKFKHPTAVTCIVFFNSELIITGSVDGILRIWSLIFQRIDYEFPKDQSITEIKCNNKLNK